MPEWLRDAGLMESPLSALTMASRLGIAAALGVVVAVIYRFSHGKHARDANTLMGTLVLLTILLAMVTMVIGDSVARAFGLVGALSIVRFRTVVDDTRDTAFVIFAVVVGMAVGTGLTLVALIGIPVVALAALALAGRGSEAPAAAGARAGSHVLEVRMGVGHAASALDGVLSARAREWRLTGLATSRQGSAVDLTYTIDLRPDATPSQLVTELNALTGVQSVELRAGRILD